MTTDDKLAIKELTHKFERTFDEAELQQHMSTWAATMSFRSPFGNYDTADEYFAWLEQFSDQMQEKGGTRHLITNHEIILSGETSATMICYLTILSRKDATIMTTTRFDDVLTKVDGDWKFSRRTLTVDQDMTQ